MAHLTLLQLLRHRVPLRARRRRLYVLQAGARTLARVCQAGQGQRVVPGRSVMELAEATFANYRRRNWNSLIYGEDPRLTCANQHK